jgi:leucyl-tRNA synthetase
MPDVNFKLEHPGNPNAQYASSSLEQRWQEAWRETRAFATPGAHDERAPAYVFADCAIADVNAHIEQLRRLTIADMCARFLRMRGRAVLFSVSFDSFGPAAELEARRSNASPREWALRRCQQMRQQFESLGLSCDWERALSSADSESYRWTQWLFLALLERDLIYRDETRWLMRVGRYVAESERGLEALTGWDTSAIDAQRAVADRIDGVEIRAGTFGAGDLTVFTPHADAIAQARFVAVSPAHPDIELWTSDPDVAKQVATMRAAASSHEADGTDDVPVVVTGALATVPGVAGIVPIVVSPLVDARFGPTAVLGIPELDASDRAIAECLPAAAGAGWKTSSSKSSARPAARYRMHDVAISRAGAWGAPIPLINCPACGLIPVPLVDLPVCLPDDLLLTDGDDNPLATRADFYACTCPGCGGAARRETDTIDPRLDTIWLWMALCVAPEHRSSSMMDDPDCARWLPAEQLVVPVDGAAGVFERRVLAWIMQDLGHLPPLPHGEPFSKALPHATVLVDDATISDDLGDVRDIDALLARVGADAVRLALLSGAAPGRVLRWNAEQLRRCEGFLRTLYLYAEPRLREWAPRSEQTAEQASIDTSDELRKRLALWCVVACEKVTGQLERVEPHRAAYNVVRLLTRIRDFESRALEHRELDAHDREAIVAALLLLTRLLAPLTPHIAEELWSVSGNATLVSEAVWPTLSPPVA